MDEIIGPILDKRWFEPLANSTDPISGMKNVFRNLVREDIKSGNYRQGCPLNNLAQEMSPLDEGFRKRIDRLYAGWRKYYADVLAAGIAAGKVRKDCSPRKVASFLAASQMGIRGAPAVEQPH